MGTPKAVTKKMRVDNVLETSLTNAQKDKLFRMLGGEPGGVAEWTYDQGVDWLKSIRTKRHPNGVNAGRTQVFCFFQSRSQELLHAQAITLGEQAKLDWAKANPDATAAELANIGLTIFIAKAISAGGKVEDLIGLVNALTKMMSAQTKADEQKQRVREYDESVAKLKAKITDLENSVNKSKDGSISDEMRSQVMELVDQAMGV